MQSKGDEKMRIKSFLHLSLLGLAASLAAPAAAQELGGGWTVTGNATIVSDYRFRGISLSNEDFAIQGGFNLNHESGFYVGTWGSSLDDTALYGETEIDFFAGYTTEVSPGTTIDAGLLYYFYPAGDDTAGNSDFFEPYASLTHTFGPVSAKVGAAYAWSQSAIGDQDNIYVYGDLGAGIPNTPVSLKAHLGYTDGSLGLAAPDGDYLDWSIGASAAFGPLSLGISYVDTDIPEAPLVDGGVVFSVGVAF